MGGRQDKNTLWKRFTITKDEMESGVCKLIVSEEETAIMESPQHPRPIAA